MCGTCGQKDKAERVSQPKPNEDLRLPANGIEPDSTTRHAKVALVNRTTSTMHNILLIHQYSNCAQEHFTWNTLEVNKETPPDLLCRFETGAGTGYDYWSLTFQLDDGSGYYVMNKQCYLTAADDFNNGGPLWFRVLGTTFYMDTRSSPCSTDLTKTPAPPY